MTADEKTAVMSRISGVVDLDTAACNVAFVEAAVENMEIKKTILQQPYQLCPAYTILTTNTSSLPMTAIAALTKRADKVVGMHFFNRAPVMKLVEVITDLATTEETFAAINGFAKAAPYVLTVCTGSFLLALTSLLDGHLATTNKMAFNIVSNACPKVNWVHKARWVVDGKYYTSSGVSAGMDMAMDFIHDINGPEVAKQAAIESEYIWNK